MPRERSALVLLLTLIIFLSGCCPASSGGKGSTIAVSVNSYNITRDEFEREFKDSVFARSDTPKSRQEFLNSLIDRKLILQYAQKKELDKEKTFLKMIERFWEQSLLKIALDKKAREITRKASVSDDEIKKAYDDMLKEGKINEPYEGAYKRIKWDLVRAKETELMNDWLAEMRKKASITINNSILENKKQ